MAGKYVGFDKLKGQLAKSPGVKDPAALAASIGRKKMGAKRFAAAAKSGGNYHGSKAKKGAFINPFPGGRSVRAESRIHGGGERYTEDT